MEVCLWLCQVSTCDFGRRLSLTLDIDIFYIRFRGEPGVRGENSDQG